MQLHIQKYSLVTLAIASVSSAWKFRGYRDPNFGGASVLLESTTAKSCHILPFPLYKHMSSFQYSPDTAVEGSSISCDIVLYDLPECMGASVEEWSGVGFELDIPDLDSGRDRTASIEVSCGARDD